MSFSNRTRRCVATRLESRWTRLAVALGMLLLAYGAWQLLGWPSGDRALTSDAFFYPVGVAASWAAWGASRRCRDQPRLRSAWRLVALASASYLAGDIAWTFYDLAGAAPYPSAADGFYLLFYPLMLCGLLRFPAPRRKLAEFVRLGLDLALVAIGGAVVVIYVVLGPTLVQSGPDVLETAFSVAYPVGDLILLVGLGSVLLRRPAYSSARSLQFVAAGLTLFVAADLAYGYITLHSTYQSGNPVDSLWMVAMALFALAGAAQASPEPGPEHFAQRQRRSASWAPYAGVAVGFGLLLFNQRDEPLLPDGLVLIAAVLLATLVSIRQFLAEKDLLQSQERLSHQSLHDVLTGLPNRALIMDRAAQMLARGRRNQTNVAAMYVDLDGYKRVNDSFGHATGDEVLRLVSARLSAAVRASDTVGRLGGDEFVILLENLQRDALEVTADRIGQAVREPIGVAASPGGSLSMTASIGIALGFRSSVDELFRDADLALYDAKGAGKNRWQVFESRRHLDSRDDLGLELDLREALEGDQFFLLYQPTFDLKTETITGLEALIRWRHPIRGLVEPDAFVPRAEETGLIVGIGRWALVTACRQAAAWQRSGLRLGISINVSARQLEQDDFIGDVAETLAITGLGASTLTLEITERSLMREPAQAERLLRELKVLGVRLAIDDFGTGCSSLSYLHQFPVDTLKIDRSFVSGIPTSDHSKFLIRTLVQLGQSLGLETLAEGIENVGQLRYLQRECCDSGQGVVLAGPLEVEEVQRLLEAGPHASPASSANSAGVQLV